MSDCKCEREGEGEQKAILRSILQTVVLKTFASNTVAAHTFAYDRTQPCFALNCSFTESHIKY